MNSIYPVEKIQEDKDLSRILKLCEIIKGYEFLVEYLLDNKTDINPLEGRGLREVVEETVKRLEKEYVLNTLIQTNFNRLETSKILKVSYKTLLAKIAEHKLAEKRDYTKKVEYAEV